MSDVVTGPGMDPTGARSVIEALARSALDTTAPDELVLFDELASEFFADPAAAVAAGKSDEAVGFGIEFAMLTPFVLTAAAAVVQFLGVVVKDAAKDELGDVLKSWLRRLTRRAERVGAEPAGPEPAPLSAAQLDELHRVALQSGRRAGLTAGTAALVADAVVGAMARGGY